MTTWLNNLNYYLLMLSILLLLGHNRSRGQPRKNLFSLTITTAMPTPFIAAIPGDVHGIVATEVEEEETPTINREEEVVMTKVL